MTPVYSIRIESTYTLRRVCLNEFVIVSLRVPRSHLQLSLPANPWLISGQNTISILLEDSNNHLREPRCVVELIHQPDFGSDDRTVVWATTVTANAAVALKGTRGGFKHAGGNFSLNVPFGPWRWESAEVVAPTPNTHQTLYRIYKRLWELFVRKDFRAIDALMTIKALEIQAAHFLPSLDDAHAALSYEHDLQDALFGPLPTLHESRLELSSSGRLARLVSADGNALLQFEEPSLSANGEIPATFCYLREFGWTLIR